MTSFFDRLRASVTEPDIAPHAGSDSTGTAVLSASTSLRGWSYYGPFMACPYLWAMTRLGGAREEETPPLARGSMGHLLLAHLAIHEEAAKGVGPVRANNVLVGAEEAREYASPVAALRTACKGNSAWSRELAHMLRVFDCYIRSRDLPEHNTIEVESELVGVVGARNKRPGLYLVAPSEWDALKAGAPLDRYRAFDGGTIEVGPEHRAGGKTVYISRRLDAVWLTPEGVEVVDHKHKSKIHGESAVSGYATDGGFTAMAVLAAQALPDRFRAIVLNLVSTNDDNLGHNRIVRLPRDPQQEARFWRDLLMTAVQMEAVAAVATRPDDYPRKRLEEVGGACNSRYGRCGLYDRCHPIKMP